jgi:hypothetical protein
MWLAAWLVLQGPLPTVGDTIWLERRILVPAGSEVRVPRWDPPEQMELIGKPEIRSEPGQAVVVYPATAWRPGSYQLVIPGPILVAPDGRTDTLPAEQRTVEVATVLPDSDPDRLRIQPPVGIVPRYITRPEPLLGALALAGALFGLLAWLWRRRGPLLAPSPEAASPAVAPLLAWVEAGETRAAAAFKARELRDLVARRVPAGQPGLDTERLARVLAEQRPTWPVAALSAVLGDLDRFAFGEAEPEDLPELLERADHLAAELRQEGP